MSSARRLPLTQLLLAVLGTAVLLNAAVLLSAALLLAACSEDGQQPVGCSDTDLSKYKVAGGRTDAGNDPTGTAGAAALNQQIQQAAQRGCLTDLGQPPH